MIILMQILLFRIHSFFIMLATVNDVQVIIGFFLFRLNILYVNH